MQGLRHVPAPGGATSSRRCSPARGEPHMVPTHLCHAPGAMHLIPGPSSSSWATFLQALYRNAKSKCFFVDSQVNIQHFQMYADPSRSQRGLVRLLAVYHVTSPFQLGSFTC